MQMRVHNLSFARAETASGKTSTMRRANLGLHRVCRAGTSRIESARQVFITDNWREGEVKKKEKKELQTSSNNMYPRSEYTALLLRDYLVPILAWFFVCAPPDEVFSFPLLFPPCSDSFLVPFLFTLLVSHSVLHRGDNVIGPRNYLIRGSRRSENGETRSSEKGPASEILRGRL